MGEREREKECVYGRERKRALEARGLEKKGWGHCRAHRLHVYSVVGVYGRKVLA